MSTIQLVVFDIAGTTVRDRGNVADSFITAFREFGLEIPASAVEKVMGFRKMDAIVHLLGKFAPAQKDDEILVDRIHSRFIQNMISFYMNDEELEPLPHAPEVFARLKQQGIKVALNTGFTRAITDTILHRLRWDERNENIDKVICSDEVPEGRPSPDMIDALVADLGITSTKNVLKIGDTEVDVEEGRNAGCGKVVSVTTGAYTREQLQHYQPDAIIDDLLELIPIIEKA
ncbi:MAG TPA: HAD-IA family hydrolase [Puia sp.]|nr:HAD-IA family hydrolase [Puia sp.]